MGHAWTPEERKQKEESGQGKPNNNFAENEYPQRLGLVRQYLNKLIDNHHSGDKDNEDFCRERLMDLDCGNERVVMEFLEDACPHSDGKTPERAELTEWRKAVFEMSKEMHVEASFSSDEISNFLMEEFEEKMVEMNLELENNPNSYNADDIKKWDKEISIWQDASIRLFKGFDNAELALSLIEKEIDDLTEYIQGAKKAKEEALKSITKDPADVMKRIKARTESIENYFEKLKSFRRMRNSIYEAMFKGQK